MQVGDLQSLLQRQIPRRHHPRCRRRSTARGASPPISLPPIHADSLAGLREGQSRLHQLPEPLLPLIPNPPPDRKSTRLNSSHANISYAVFCLKKKKKNVKINTTKKL